jgi:tetratricopeptide (TPR) repeat protein
MTTTAGGTGVTASIIKPHTATTVRSRAVGSAGVFTLEQVLAKPVVGQYLDQLAARKDASSPAARALLEQARSASLDELEVSDSLAKEAPVASAFLKGLALLKQGKLDPAAVSFRQAMRAGVDFYPAMVYLGACYAAGGQDKEAAGAFRTALIREGDRVDVHIMLSDALLRTGRGDLAMQALKRARDRWPEDDSLKRRYAVAAVAAGLYADGLTVVDDLVTRKADDEPVLSLALLVLYDAFVSNHPVETIDQDRARMAKFAEAYRARGGPSVALVDTWMAAADKKKR